MKKPQKTKCVGRLGWDPAEFAELHGIGRSRVYAEIAEGALPSMKVGRRRIITPEHRAEWLNRKAAADA